MYKMKMFLCSSLYNEYFISVDHFHVVQFKVTCLVLSLALLMLSIFLQNNIAQNLYCDTIVLVAILVTLSKQLSAISI